MIPIVRKKITLFFDADILMDIRTNPQEIVALGAAYLAFQLANADQVRQVEIKQRVEDVVPTYKAVPILFGYKDSYKWMKTIFAVDRETY